MTHDVQLGHRVVGESLDGLVEDGLTTVTSLLLADGVTIAHLTRGLGPHLVTEGWVITDMTVVMVTVLRKINGEAIFPGVSRVAGVTRTVDVSGGEISVLSDT